MAETQFALLVPFNETNPRWFRDAYKWDRFAIFAWLDKVAENPIPYGADGTDTGRFALLAKYIKSLSLSSTPGGASGVGFTDPDSKGTDEPIQHISRTWNDHHAKSGVGRPAESSSLFHVAGWVIDEIRFWSPYDMLGYFLGLLGAPPPAATRANYFLPLMAVYGKWCSKIAGNFGGQAGVGDPPYMFQCTWRVDDKGVPLQYRLGASLAGFDTGGRDRDTGAWLYELQSARHKLLCDQRKPDRMRIITPGLSSHGAAKAPQLRVNWEDFWGFDPHNQANTFFGNCAETYPFIDMFKREPKLNQRPLHGLALTRGFLSSPVYDATRNGPIHKHVRSPCGNCKFLLNKGRNQPDYDIYNFKSSFQWASYPEKDEG